MLFNSYIFILLFLPIAVGGYFLLAKTRNPYLPKLFLFFMSLWFYGYFNIKYLPIIIISIIANYSLCFGFRKLKKHGLKKMLMVTGILLNVGILFYYKYLGFFIGNINALFRLDWTVINLVLPLGISFFTFQQVSYVIDSYKGLVPPYNILDYSLFVIFFPQLIAGPIVLHNEIIPQFENPKKKVFKPKNFAKGIIAFTFGLAKKVLLADMFGKTANYGFSHISDLDTTNTIIVILSYTLQIYFDFSGYCDMATGLGLFFNIKIPQNFNSPYRALDIDDFWKRWHMTLTRFLRTHIYIPLGGNRKGKLRTYVNMFIVFMVSGIWHGANWTFILWGFLHGVAIIITKLISKPLSKLRRNSKPLLWIITFVFVSLSWVYFRADSIADANEMLLKLIHFDFGAVSKGITSGFITSEYGLIQWAIGKVSAGAASVFPVVLVAGYIVFGLFASVLMKNTNERISDFKPSRLNLAVTCVLLIWSLISLSQVSTFLYFNF